MAPAITVQLLDELLMVLVGDGEGGDGHGLVILDQDQPARPKGVEGPPAGHVEGVGSGVFSFGQNRDRRPPKEIAAGRPC